MSASFVSATKVMEILGVSYPTVLRMVKEKRIPYVYVGRSLKFPSSFFESLEERALQTIKPQEEF